MTFHDLVLKSKNLFSVSRTLYWANWGLGGCLIWVSGATMATVIETQFLEMPRQEKKFTAPFVERRDKSRSLREFKDIVDLNVFDAETNAPKKEVPVEKEITRAPVGAKLQEVISKLTLMGVYQGSGYFCIIKNNRTKKEDIFGIDDEIFDTQAMVSKIQVSGTKIVVQIRLNDEYGVLEYDDIDDKSKVSSSQSSRSSKPAKSRTRPVSPPSRSDGTYVSRGSERVRSEYSPNGTDFYLKNNEVQHHLKNFSTLLNQAKVVPYMEDGRPVGYTIKNITRGSLYEKLGLKNYDVIKRVNGNEIDSMEKAIELFNALKNEREITINILRKNEPISFNYHIN